MKLEIPENFSEIIVDKEFVKLWIKKAEQHNYDKDYYKYVFIRFLLFGEKIKFNTSLDRDYLMKSKRFFYFWVNSFFLSLEEKSLFCSYILSFIAKPGKINKRIFNKIKGLLDENNY